MFQHLPKGDEVSINIYHAAKAIESVLSKEGVTVNGTEYLGSFLFYGVRVTYRKELLGVNIPVLVAIEYLESGLWRISMFAQLFGFEIRKDMFDVYERKLLNEYGVRVCLMPGNSAAGSRKETEVEVYSLAQGDGRISKEVLSSHIQLVQSFIEDIIRSTVGNQSTEMDCARWSVLDKTVDISLLESDDNSSWFDFEVHWARAYSDDPIYKIKSNMSYDERIDNTLDTVERTEEKKKPKVLQMINPNKDTILDWR